MPYIRFIWVFIIGLLFSGCWPEDEPLNYIDVITPPGTKVVTLSNSIYTHQMFFNLRNNELVSTNGMTDWDLGFESSSDGNHIILNTADVLEVANLGPVNFSTNSLPVDSSFIYDASSGNFDSLAINDWLVPGVFPYQFTQNLYYLGKTDGVAYTVFKKFKIIGLSDTTYTLVLGNLSDVMGDTLRIFKNDDVVFTKVKLTANGFDVVNIEPEKSNWDIVFTQYSTILYTEEGVATDYIVRGTLINPYQTRVGKYYINDSIFVKNSEVQSFFNSIDNKFIDSVSFSTSWDIIGWDWKDVTVDETSNTSTYEANPRKVYIIQTQDGSFFKLHFTNFYNLEGVKGYPSFEFAMLK